VCGAACLCPRYFSGTVSDPVNAIAKFKKGAIEDKKLKPLMRHHAKQAFAESKHAQSASERKAMLNGLKRNGDAMIEQLTQRCFQVMNQ